ncbi:nucleotide excision repair endonuclease [Bacillus mesophilum]|uniref:Nucleotide excision repair endonuclease n=1 Tax=Bacillus mesophilum TaxID=1071718 RepID=A0A7V7UW10_9BACI|nr:nucleotide excision repair endonuclease [Bacillus mesophilum]KAB2333444.1 nucleotide excision repair endonuclease [Bacillus mesophilum]
MIKIDIPEPNLVITKKQPDQSSSVISNDYGFVDYHKIPRDKGGLILFLDADENLMFVGKARKLRQRVKKHFEDNVSPIKKYRDDVYKIAIILVEDAMEREIYETYIINTLHAEYNIDKVFYK